MSGMQTALVLGDTLNFATSVPDYLPSAGWTLKFRLIPRTSGSAIDITTTQDSSDSSLHRAQVAASVTTAWTAGTYNWASWVEKALEKYSVSSGVIVLRADPRTGTAPFDLRTDAQVALDQAKAALAAWSPTTKRYMIAGREMWFNDVGEILKVISYWENQVSAEANVASMAAGLKNRKRIQVRLSRG